ncbi:hypothetical protein AB6A40_006070 [Gnathostoma spinigerum]|uniref:Uncharacterized protein n=1 Tax=Gnathostoma spinigerum TaxID=75299 RepID=A0ABD6EPK5_9BILA
MKKNTCDNNVVFTVFKGKNEYWLRLANPDSVDKSVDMWVGLESEGSSSFLVIYKYSREIPRVEGSELILKRNKRLSIAIGKRQETKGINERKIESYVTYADAVKS